MSGIEGNLATKRNKIAVSIVGEEIQDSSIHMNTKPRINVPLWSSSHGNKIGHADEESIRSAEEALARARNLADEENKKRRDRDPLLLCKFIMEHPKLAFGITLGGHISFIVITGILVLAGYNILPVDFKAMPMDLNGNERLRDLGWTLRNEDTVEMIQRWNWLTLLPTWNQGQTSDILELYFQAKECNGGNVFTADNLKRMEEIESRLYNNEKYQKSFCQRNEDGDCIKPTSIVRYFDGTYKNIDPIFFDPNYTNIPAVLYAAQIHPDTVNQFNYHMTKSSHVSATKVHSEYVRSFLPMGYPLGPPYNTSDETAMNFHLRSFLADSMKPEIERERDKCHNYMDIVYISARLWGEDTNRQVSRDMVLIFCSFAFIFLFLWIQTHSLWITGWAIFSIITCFLCTNLIYRIIFDYRYFGYYHVITMYMILGIGADDLFVFFNAWRATALWDYKSDAHRLSDAFRKSAGTMLFTSLTTMVAFFTSALSPLLALNSFGVFAGTLVAVNYISVIIFFPCVILNYDLYFKQWSWPCCRPCIRKYEQSKKSNLLVKELDEPDVNTGEIIDMNKSTSSVQQTLNEDVSETPKLQREEKPHAVVVFFGGPYYRFVTHYIAKWVIIGVTIGVVAFFTYWATQLKPAAETSQIWRGDTNYGRANHLTAKVFTPMSSDLVQVDIVWGMKNRDVSGCHFSDYTCSGRQVWDDTFDLNNPEAQMALKNFCNRLKHLSSSEIRDLSIRRNPSTQQLEINCFIDDFNTYLRENFTTKLLVGNTTLNYTVLGEPLDFPLTENKMKPFMEQNPLVYDFDTQSQTFFRYFEIGISHWMTSGYTMLPSEDYFKYNELLGEARDGNSTRLPRFWPREFLPNKAYYGTKLKYAAIRVNLTVSALSTGFIDGLPLVRRWDNFISSEMAKLPVQLRGGFQTSGFWHWLKIQESLVDNAVQGIIISLALAIPVLVIATKNVIIGIISTITICMSTACVLGMLPLLGWTLGVMTSMNMCIVVGLTVDFVVHLAEAYHQSVHQDRLGRLHDALEHIAISILWGGATTMGASAFMCFGQIQYFLQFGIFMLSTIGFALLSSLGFLATFLGICGPEGETGNIVPLLRRIKYLITGRGPLDKDCTLCEGKGYIRNPDRNTITPL